MFTLITLTQNVSVHLEIVFVSFQFNPFGFSCVTFGNICLSYCKVSRSDICYVPKSTEQVLNFIYH